MLWSTAWLLPATACHSAVQQGDTHLTSGCAPYRRLARCMCTRGSKLRRSAMPLVQRRAELVARLVQACGPPAAQDTGRTLIVLLLRIAMGVARWRCAPLLLWYLLCKETDRLVADVASPALLFPILHWCVAAACSSYAVCCGIQLTNPVSPSRRPLPAAASQPLLATLRALAAFLRPPCSPAAVQALWSAEVVREWAAAIGTITEVPTSPHLSPANCCTFSAPARICIGTRHSMESFQLAELSVLPKISAWNHPDLWRH